MSIAEIARNAPSLTFLRALASPLVDLDSLGLLPKLASLTLVSSVGSSAEQRPVRFTSSIKLDELEYFRFALPNLELSSLAQLKFPRLKDLRLHHSRVAITDLPVAPLESLDLSAEEISLSTLNERFPALRYLDLSNSSTRNTIDFQNSLHPGVRSLTIYNCSAELWKSAAGCFPAVDRLILLGCHYDTTWRRDRIVETIRCQLENEPSVSLLARLCLLVLDFTHKDFEAQEVTRLKQLLPGLDVRYHSVSFRFEFYGQ